jgi:hypothetical protein
MKCCTAGFLGLVCKGRQPWGLVVGRRAKSSVSLAVFASAFAVAVNRTADVVQGKGRQKGKDIAVPLELMSVKAGQKRQGLLIGEQQARLVRMSAQKPAEKRQDIEAWIKKTVEKRGEVERDFGLTVSENPVEIDGRFLPTPVIEYKEPKHYYSGAMPSKPIDYHVITTGTTCSYP